MAIVVAEETVIALADVTRHVPPRRGGKKLHQATAFRWAKDGVRGVKLETIRIGGTLCTSVEALQRFFEALSAPAATVAQPTAVRSPAARQRAIEAADRELEAMGV